VMRQTLTLYSTTPDNYIIQTVSREQVIDLADGDYIITTDLQEQLTKIWAETDMSGCTVRVVNG
jgi:hypothetical protein